ncbi:immunoglobulin lambda-1 light chain-like isoform X1 [Genypterus blacodes]|uniref:immunoglobulin lambda-1 light chain-like isoform X1 n=1 Tax=Genypterus blacodes TaxID=154954 RepID=UPI003F7764F9
MLRSLCTLITALTCVSGVTLVTQKPPVVAKRTGETVTMDCNLGTVTNSAARWYKQIPGRVPQFVLYFHHSHSSPTYGSGFSSSWFRSAKFTSNHQSKSDYRLIINNLVLGDSAVYYCQTWDSSVSEVVFGQGTKLIVTSSSLSPPVLTVFPPSKAELSSSKATLLCLTSQSVGFADVTWLSGGSPVTRGVSTSTPVQQPDQTFQMSSALAIQPSDWNAGRVYTCKVSVGSQTSEKNIQKSDCPNDD